jgi:hypothetical protein
MLTYGSGSIFPVKYTVRIRIPLKNHDHSVIQIKLSIGSFWIMYRIGHGSWSVGTSGILGTAYHFKYVLRLQVAFARLKARKRGEEHLIHLDYLKVTLFSCRPSRSGSPRICYVVALRYNHSSLFVILLATYWLHKLISMKVPGQGTLVLASFLIFRLAVGSV